MENITNKHMRDTHPLKKTHHLTVIPGLLLVILLGAALVLYLGLITVPSVFSRDTAAPDIRDLALTPRDFAEGQNGYPALQRAIDEAKLTDLDAGIIVGANAAQEWTSDEARAVVAKYSSVLEALTVAAKATILEDPDYATAETTEAAYQRFMNEHVADERLIQLRQFITLLRVRAFQAASEEKMDTALNDAMAIAQVGQKLSEARNMYIGQAVARAILDTGLDTFRSVAATLPLSPTDARSWAEKLPTGDTARGIVAANQTEGLLYLRHLPTVITSEMAWMTFFTPLYTNVLWVAATTTGQTQFMFHFHESQALLANVLRANNREAIESCLTVQPKNYERDATLYQRAWRTGNGYGQLSAAEYERMMPSAGKYHCDTLTSVAETKASLAARAYERQTGELPSTLSALVPDYLAAVPTDPYSGQPVLYDRAQRLVYSVGIDHRPAIGSPKENLYIFSNVNPTLSIITGQEAKVTPTSAKTNVYYIAVDDNGQAGDRVGCGDSVVAVAKTLSTDYLMVNRQIRATLEALLAEKSATIGQSGLSNPLSNSSLSVASVDLVQQNGQIDNNTWSAATTVQIKLTGTVVSGGVCDDPRIIAQITKTAQQFAVGSKLDITINGKPMTTVLSGRGQ